MSAKGSLAVVLHAHLPFIRHPEYDWYLEEDWFFEAVTECYIPLIRMTESLAQDNIRAGYTISLSPTLCALMEDSYTQNRCYSYLDKHIKLAQKELSLIELGTASYRTAKMYLEMYTSAIETLDKYAGNLVEAFKHLQEQGLIEIITTTATHSVLPLLAHKEAVRAQISIAHTEYTERFGKKPRGLWLPECGFSPAITESLQVTGFKYFFLENHAFDFANPRPRYGVFAPANIRGGLHAFARDAQNARQVWSASYGYPGHPSYREFYRDLGYDANYDYIRPYLHPDGVRRNLGIKYHKITGNVDLSIKQPYDPLEAQETVMLHARDFLEKLLNQIDEVNNTKGIRPVIVGTYDAELFGHWWLEGPKFLEQVLRAVRQERLPLQTITASEALNITTDPAQIEPETCTWGEGGYFSPWINKSNDWIYPRTNEITEKIIQLANRFQHQDINSIQIRVLNQAAREVLLSQSSDWAFLMHINSHAEYAQKRITEHFNNFKLLAHMITSGDINEEELLKIEQKNNIFKNTDFKIFTSASAL